MIVGTLVCAAAGWSGYRLLDPATLPIAQVRVSGPLQRVDRADLKRVISPRLAPGFLRVDMGELRQAVESLAWVRSASVKRLWPDAIEVVIEEQQAVARWNNKALVNPAGELFEPPAEEHPRGLPSLKGPNSGQVPLVAGHYSEMQRILAPARLRIAELTMNERHAWQLTLENGIAVLIGRENAYPRVMRLARAYPSQLAARLADIETIDLRYTNGFAVKWRSGRGSQPAKGAGALTLGGRNNVQKV